MLSENLPLPPTLYDSLKMTTKMIPRHDYELLQQPFMTNPFYAIANQYYRFIMFILYAIMKKKDKKYYKTQKQELLKKF